MAQGFPFLPPYYIIIISGLFLVSDLLVSKLLVALSSFSTGSYPSVYVLICCIVLISNNFLSG